MAWSTFFGVVMGAYAVYYVLNFLYDLFISRKQMAPADTGVHYEMEELADAEEQAYDLSEEAEDGYQYDEEEYDAEEEEEDQPYEQEELSKEPAPALRVEGQGIPLEEFLKEAKSYSGSIF